MEDQRRDSGDVGERWSIRANDRGNINFFHFVSLDIANQIFQLIY